MENSLMSASELTKKDLKKHVAAIQVSNKVGLLGRKSWNVLLLNAYEDLLKKDKHEIPLSVLCETTGHNSRNYESIKMALKRLQTTLVEWDILGGADVNGVWVDNCASAQMLGSWKISEGVLEYYFPQGLPELLFEPSVYQRIDISQQKLFKSSHSLALWENCFRYVGVGSTGFIEVDKWRELLGGTGKIHQQYKFFKVKVLNPAIKEVNEVSNISVEMQTEKKGRKITKICFLVKEKEQKNLFSDALHDLKASAEYEDLLKVGAHKVQAIKWLGDHSFPYIREKLNLLAKVQQKKTLDNPVGWLRKAIENDYADSEVEQKQAQKKLRSEREEKERKEAETRRLEERKLELSKIFTNQKIEGFLKDFPEKKQEKFLEKVKKDNPMMADFIKSITDPFVKSQLVKIIPNYEAEKERYISENL